MDVQLLIIGLLIPFRSLTMPSTLDRTLCPKCNFDEDIVLFKKGFLKQNAEYELVFMIPMKYTYKNIETGKPTQITPGVYYCHECGCVEKTPLLPAKPA